MGWGVMLTGVPDGGADGVAAVEEELDEPGGDVARGAGDAHHLPHPGAHLAVLFPAAAAAAAGYGDSEGEGG